jgi:hypothetical protein
MTSWQAIRNADGLLVADEQQVLVPGSWLLGLLAVASVAVLAGGWLAAPLLTSPGAGLVGTPRAPSLTLSTVGLVTAVALAVGLSATLVPAIRAARTSTVAALAETGRPPRRRGWLIAVSARLPVPLLLGLRLAARRPRRLVLSALSIARPRSPVTAPTPTRTASVVGSRSPSLSWHT